MPTNPQLNAFSRAYLETALWSSHDFSDESGGEPLDASYSLDDFALQAIARAIKNCTAFERDNEADLEAVHDLCDQSRAGFLFWLNRNGHGSGFWDEYFGNDDDLRAAFRRLSDASKAWGSCDAYVGDDGQIYLS